MIMIDYYVNIVFPIDVDTNEELSAKLSQTTCMYECGLELHWPDIVRLMPSLQWIDAMTENNRRLEMCMKLESEESKTWLESRIHYVWNDTPRPYFPPKRFWWRDTKWYTRDDNGSSDGDDDNESSDGDDDNESGDYKSHLQSFTFVAVLSLFAMFLAIMKLN
jgi:hypothetical protein